MGPIGLTERTQVLFPEFMHESTVNIALGHGRRNSPTDKTPHWKSTAQRSELLSETKRAMTNKLFI